MNFISSHSNNIHAREQLRSIKDKASNPSQVVRFCWLYPTNHSHPLSLPSRINKKLMSSIYIYIYFVLQFVKKMLASLPFSCQSQSPSPYFDQSLFRFDDKVYTVDVCLLLYFPCSGQNSF